MTSAVSIWLVAILGASAALKARRPGRASAALATYGVRGARAQMLTMWSVVALEAGVAAALGLDARWAPAAAGGLFLVFALATAGALAAGRSGRPCACFGGDTRLGWSSPLRATLLCLAAAAVALDWLPRAHSGYETALTIGLSLSLAAAGALAVAVLGLAREVGVLRLGLSTGTGALEVPHEGPEVGVRQPWAEALTGSPRAVLGVAIFSSEGCQLCRQVSPAVEHLAGDPVLAVRVFDEAHDGQVWRAAEVPGSPYAVALSLDGVALAKGSFNSLSQLESIIATARRREAEFALAA